MKNIIKGKGFTLVELLVVISIIALLLAVLIPALQRARAQSQKVVCATRMKQTGVAQIAWSFDHGGYATPILEDLVKLQGLTWAQQLVKYKYAPDLDFFRCPIGNPNKRTIENFKILPAYQIMFTYGLYRGNSGWGETVKISSSIIRRNDNYALDLKNLMYMKASDFILIGDSVNLYKDYERYYGPEIQFYYMSPFADNRYPDTAKLALRHLKTGEFLMADGSVANRDTNTLINKHHVSSAAIYITKR